MSRHTLVRGALAAAMGIALSAGALVPLATPAVADTATAEEVVIPPSYYPTPDQALPYRAERSGADQADSVGSTGAFFLQADQTAITWTRFSDGKTFPYSKPTTAYSASMGTGTDAIAYIRAGEVELRTGTGTSRIHPLPAGLSGTKVFGTTAAAYKTITRTDGTKTSERHLFSLRPDGTTPELTITGLTSDAPLGAAIAGDTSGLVLQGEVRDGKRRHGIVNPTTGKVEAVTPPMPESYTHVKLSPKYLVAYSTVYLRKALVASRTNPSAPLVEVPIDTMASGLHHLSVVGDWLVYRQSDFANLSNPHVRAVPIAGGPSIGLIHEARPRLASGPGGTAVAIGGTDSSDWAIRRITAGADGKPVVSVVKKLMHPGRLQRLAIAQGKLHVVDDSNPSGELHAFTTQLSATGTPTAGTRYQSSDAVEPCAAGDTACARFLTSGDGRFLLRKSYSDTLDAFRLGDETLRLPKGSSVTDVSAEYLIHTSPSAPGKQYVMRTKDAKVMEERAEGAAALWGSVLWTAGTANGAVTAKELATGTTVETVATGAPCVPKELQAAGRWIYWSCGANGPAGVYDRTAKSSVTVPSGESLLGDGYVVTHDKAAGKLVLTGTDATKPVSRVVGTLADTGYSQRNIRWSVDRFGGHLAYADTTGQVHVVPTGIAAQPLSVVGSWSAPEIEPTVEGMRMLTVRFSKPVSSWTVTMRNKKTGAEQELEKGGEVRGALHVGFSTDDVYYNNSQTGAYTWTVTAQPADGVGPAVQHSGDTVVMAGYRYHPLPPTRVMDTRNGTGVAKAKLGPGGTVTLPIVGRGGIPAGASVRAVALHVTATNATAATSIRAYPGNARPSMSQFTVPAGKTVANPLIVPSSGFGTITLENQAGTVDLVADVAGYYAWGEGDHFRPLNPVRVMDTRSGLGVPKAKVKGGTTLTLPVAGRSGVPTTGVTAVAINMTASNATAATAVSVVPKAGTTSWTGPTHLNVSAAQALSNLVVVPVVDGKIHFFNRSGDVDLVGDIAGYYTTAKPGSVYKPRGPYRIMDTRTGLGFEIPKAKVGPGGTLTLNVSTVNGVPYDATAVALNVSAANATAATSISAYPAGATRNKAYYLTTPAGKVVANLVIVPVVNGKVTFYNSTGSVDLIADLVGVYAE